MGGRFVLSDDSHGIAQVATCYPAALKYLASVGITELAVFDLVDAPQDSRFRGAASETRTLASLTLQPPRTAVG